MLRIMSAIGLVAMIALAWGVSENRRRFPWRIVLWGLVLQVIVGVLMFKTPLKGALFFGVQQAFDVLTAAANEGSSFVFGALTKGFVVKKEALEGAQANLPVNAVFAFQVLPVIIVVSSISAILFHLGVIQAVVRGIAWCMQRTLKTSGAETFTAALQIFLGIESVTAIRGYLARMTRSELCTIMVTYMASIAGSVMVVYANFGAEPGHLLAASIMSAPAAILVSKIMVPETEEPETSGAGRLQIPIETQNVLDAASRGASEGMAMAISVAAMVITFISLVYLMDLACVASTGKTFPTLAGYVFRPFAFLMGVPPRDVAAVGELLGTKSILNEFLAYVRLGEIKDTLSPRSVTIATYALCGFANPGSLGIAIAALCGLIPERRKDISSLGIKSLIGGTLSCFIMACVAGILLAE